MALSDLVDKKCFLRTTRLSTTYSTGKALAQSETIDEFVSGSGGPCASSSDPCIISLQRGETHLYVLGKKAICILSRYLDNWQFTFHFLRFPIKTDQFTILVNAYFGRRHLVT